MGVYLFTGIVIRRPELSLDFFAGYTLAFPLIKQSQNCQVEFGYHAKHTVNA
jgi:hypothetical protein